MKLFRKKADYRTIGFIFSYFIWTIFIWNIDPQNTWLKVSFILPTCLLSWIAAIITHNTLHHPIFTKRWLNRFFQVVLTLTYGFPVSEYIPGHNLSHHRHTQTPKDVMRTTKVQFQWNLLNFFLFMPMVAGDVTRANMRYARLMKERRPAWHRQLLLETTACWGSKLLLLLFNWHKCTLYVIIPHLFALWAITTINYVWHDGCDLTSPYNHSRNFIGKLFNWFTFNNGYHGMHHIQPALHWSLLPSTHENLLHPYIHPALEEKSLLIYLFRIIIFPGKRLTYDKSPINLPPNVPDEDWILAEENSPLLQAT